MKHGIGQKVKIKDFSELVKEFGTDTCGNIIIGNCFFNRQMKVYCGEEYRIKNTYSDGTYELDLQDGGEWYFTEEMFEGDKAVTVNIDTEQPNAVEDKPKRTYTRRK